MENEIKVNDFVRTFAGYIFKVLKISEEDKLIYYYGDQPEWIGEWKENIVKHSPNLKDVIQKDDFVNKCRVYEVEEKGITVYQTIENSATDYNWISFDEIEEIVTKEMMESISYKIERK